MLRLEGGFIEELRAEVRRGGSRWRRPMPDALRRLVRRSQGQIGRRAGRPRCFPWLAERRDRRDELRWFFEQEAAGEAGFDDLVAHDPRSSCRRDPSSSSRATIGTRWVAAMPKRHARPDARRTGPRRSAVDARRSRTTVWESLSLANAMTAMATARRYAWHSLGALGVIELTAPGRSDGLVAKGLRRIGLSDRERRYFDLHAVLDIKHSAGVERGGATAGSRRGSAPRDRDRRRRAHPPQRAARAASIALSRRNCWASELSRHPGPSPAITQEQLRGRIVQPISHTAASTQPSPGCRRSCRHGPAPA